jgi:hypothetical protein
MARVQVRDLPDAPQLQATVQSGGNFGVSVQQAGSNKLMDLADTLSGFNTALKEYGRIAVIDAEMEEDEIKRLKPEELSARLSDTEKKFDSLSRKGVIPWLASPLNQKRKRRAEGKAAHDLFVQRLIDSEGRLENPQEGDNDKTTAQIIEEERQAFIAENPALQEGTYGGEGFQEVLNPTVLNLTRQYDGRKATVAKAETLLQNTSAIYRLAKDAPLDSAEYDLVMEQSLRSRDGGAGPWAELNSFNAAQQIKVIENVAEQLANLPGGEQRAYEFLQYAEDNFYVGNQLFYKNEDQVDRIMNSIEREVEAAQRIREGGRDKRLEIERSEFVVALSAIENTGKGMYKGVEYTDRFQLNRAAQEFARKDDDVRFRGPAIEQFEQVFKGDLDTNQYQRELIRRKSQLVNGVGRQVDFLAGSAATDRPELAQDPRFTALRNETTLKLGNKITDKLDEMIRTGVASDSARAASELDAFITNLIDSEAPLLTDRINKLGEDVRKTQEQVIKAQNELAFNLTEPEVENTLSRFVKQRLGFGNTMLGKSALYATAPALLAFTDETPEDIAGKVSHNINVAGNKDTTDENRKIALQYINTHKDKSLKHLSTIASPNSKQPAETVNIGGYLHTYPQQPYTSEERKKAETSYFQIARLTGEFQNLETLENKITRDGLKFEFGPDVNSFNTVLTTPEQIEEALKSDSNPNAVPADVKKIAEIVGESDDILKFIRQQGDLHKALEYLNK